MSTEIIALISTFFTGVFSVIAVLVSNQKSNKEIQSKLDKQQAVFEAHVTEQISGLQKTVEKHNNMIERTYKLEESSSLHEAELKRVNKRLEALEH